MARGLTFSEMEKMSSGGSGGSYFSLKNDKDEAQVRIMLNKLEDMEDGFLFQTHEVEIGDNRRKVACLREYNDPMDVCPLCAAKKKLAPTMYIPIYNVDADEVQIWERGKGYMNKFTGFCSRYSKPSIVSHLVTIQRNGAKGDMKTTYELYEDDRDDTTLEDLPEIPEILGRYLLDKSAEDMDFYLETGEFPPEDNEEEEPVRRRGSSKPRGAQEEDVDDADEEERPRRSRTERGAGKASRGRRTPATSDKF